MLSAHSAPSSLSPGLRRRGPLEPSRILLVEAGGSPRECDLGDVLDARDLLVINDAATLPAALPVTTRGERAEVRLVEPPSRTRAGTARFRAVLLGWGARHTRTEDRPPPPRVMRGAALDFMGLRLLVKRAAFGGRFVVLETEEPFDALAAHLYAHAQLVQYAYIPTELRLWDVQTRFARAPFAVEAPSAGYLLPSILPCETAFLSHAAGLSDTGDARLNERLPFAERYDLPHQTVTAIERTRARGGRVIAVGTSVTRALESAARSGSGQLVPGSRMTHLRLRPESDLEVVQGILTGVHEAHTSHRSLLEAFVPRETLERAFDASARRGFLGHEFGDGWIVLAEKRRFSAKERA